MSQAGPTNIPQLHFTRFLAAFSVVIFHFGRETWPFDLPGIHTLFSYGTLAVSYFFCLSGFILAVVYSGNQGPFPFKKYFTARLARIYPLYLGAFLITLWLIIIFKKDFPRAFSVILQALGLHAWVPGETLEMNFPAWSVSVEMFFYLVFPFLVLFFHRFGWKITGIAAFIFWAISGGLQIFMTHYSNTVLSRVFDDFMLRSPILHLNAFIFGFATGAIFRSVPLRNPVPAGIPLAMIFGGLSCFLGSFWLYEDLTHYGTNGLYAPLFMLIIVGLSLDKSALSRFLSKPIFVVAGEMSYGIYLLQCPVVIAYKLFKGMGNSDPLTKLQFLKYSLVLMLSSYLSFRFFEGPARRFIRNRILGSGND